MADPKLILAKHYFTTLSMNNRTLSQKIARILIVEDEILIADTIRMHLEKKGYEVIDNAISYGEAVVMFREQRPDLVLLDIRLSGRESGIEMAQYLRRQPDPPPFKPIHAESLIASIEIALFNFRISPIKQKSIYLKDQGTNFAVPLDTIEYLRAEHVYVRFVMNDGKEVLQRGTLRQVLARLGDGRFVQTHRGYVINTNLVTGYEHDGVYFRGTKIPVSRSRRSTVMAMLEGGKF